MVFFCFLFVMRRCPPRSTRTYTLFPYTTLFLSTVQLSLAGASLVFVDGRCHKAGGSVTAQLAGVLESPLQLEGTVSCDGARGRLALQALEPASLPRSEERSVGQECVSTCRSSWTPVH